MVFAAIFAGGSGSRMGSGVLPKQYISLGGKPVIIRTLSKFIDVPDFERIYVLCPQSFVEYTRGLIDEYIGNSGNYSAKYLY